MGQRMRDCRQVQRSQLCQCRKLFRLREFRRILEVLDQEARRYTGRALLIVVPILALVAVAYAWWYRRRASQGRQG